VVLIKVEETQQGFSEENSYAEILEWRKYVIIVFVRLKWLRADLTSAKMCDMQESYLW